VLAYVFWHTPSHDGDSKDYEVALERFHGALTEASPDGFIGCSSHAVRGAPWLRDPLYEDWYLVESWAALGTLNEAAVDTRRRAPHDGLASAVAGGAGAVYMLRAGRPSVADAGEGLWFEKPPGTPYASFRDRLAALVGERGGIWERQLALGPAPEYCAVDGASAAAPSAATVVSRRRVFASGDGHGA
jgi:hypothetical protein